MDPKKQLAKSIQGWIHMDNLVESFTKQASNARVLRTKHEQESIHLIKEMGLNNSTIKVTGATLMLEKKKNTAGLSWSYLEKEIPAWATKSGITPTQAANLLAWLHSHREIKETESLKKTNISGALS
jgi:ERCC4-type nuclease